jgi:glutathione S-transferase
MTIHLLTIPISHYCEKARWGLERLGLAYREEAHIQGFHYWRTWRLSRQPLVPVLIDNVLGIESRPGSISSIASNRSPRFSG